MNFKQLNSKQIGLITRGIREAFKRSEKYVNALKSSRVVKERFKQDGTISKVPDVYHLCNGCNSLFKPLEVQVDHITPVVPLNMAQNNMTIQQYFDSTFENPIQVLCKPCHKLKSKIENKQRRDYLKNHA